MNRTLTPAVVLFGCVSILLAQGEADKRYPEELSLKIPHILTDDSVKYDYPIVYVRVPRKGDDIVSKWAEISHPVALDAGGDLMLLQTDGSEEVLVEGGAGSVVDPVVSLDGTAVFYSHIHDMKINWAGKHPKAGADIYKLDLKTRKITRLTYQKFEPNTGMGDWSSDYVSKQEGKTYFDYGVFNMGPCPLPGGRLAFTSNRHGFRPPEHNGPTLQLFVMDEDGSNVDCIGHLNISMALHPTVLQDGRIMFSSMETQALRSNLLWGLWTIHPDGTNWAPMISAFDTGGAPNAFHFQTQLSDGSIVAEEYYNQNNSGFGAYFKLPPRAKEGYAAFGPGWRGDERNPPLRFGRHYNSKPKLYRLPFSPYGLTSLTRFANNGEGAADPAIVGKNDSPRVGKFTHPAGAPDNHLLTVYSPGPGNHQNGLKKPAIDGGIYLIKNGGPIDRPDQMRLIKNDPEYNEQWPRAVVSYERIHGVKEPATIPTLANDGSLSKHLPAGTPFGLVGTSSMLKRESYPEGAVHEGSVTASFVGTNDRNGFQGLDPFNTSQNGASLNWFNQGAEAGVYSDDDVHAVRILAMEPTTDRHHGFKSGRQFYSHAQERLRILGEIPVRKFGKDGEQPIDSDGNPDTSFLAKIPADTAFTFQTIDKNGMVLNMAQTWHQLRPGEVRHDCGGCHAHSQKPTDFNDTFAARKDYEIFDLTEVTPLLTAKENGDDKHQWDAKNETSLRNESTGVVNVEYRRDVLPILQRSCVACHTTTGDRQPAGNLNLNADDELVSIPNRGKWPGTYYRLAADSKAQFGHKPVIHNGSWRQSNASRYIRKFQSRRSLLVWKIYGERLDGWSNDDFPTAKTPGDAETLQLKGEPIANTQANRDRSDLDFHGSIMPPPAAVKAGKVEPLSDEDRRTIVRWIDLGCPIDYDTDAKPPEQLGYGWFGDDKRPTLTIAKPKPGANKTVDRIVIGLADYYSGIDDQTLSITADFNVNGRKAGEELLPQFSQTSDGVWETKLLKDLAKDQPFEITVSVKDKHGNEAKVKRKFVISE